MSETKVVILGAGPAGLTYAYIHKQKGHHVTVIERSTNIGGLSKGISFLDSRFDLGPHSFYSNYSRETQGFFQKFIGKGNFSKIKSSKLIQTSEGALFYFPLKFPNVFKPKNFVFFTGYAIYKLKALLSFTKRKTLNEKHGYWLKTKIFDPYCLKYFNLKSDAVSSDFAELLYANNKDKHDGSLYTPNAGYIGKLWENVYEHLCLAGVNFEFDQEVIKIEVEGDNIVQVRTASTTVHHVDHVVSTIPLQSIVKLVFPNKSVDIHLNYRSTIIVFLEVEALRTNALYLTNYDVGNPIGRISFCSNWKNEVSRHVISAELWCNESDPIFGKTDSAITAHVISYLKTLPVVVVKKNAQSKIIKIPKCYPVLDKGYAQKVSSVSKQLSWLSNLELTGRHGRFQWDGLDDIINAALHE